jgi:uncharacterized membrane protein
VHPLLIVLPLGLLGMSVVLDVVGLVTRSAVWGVVTTWDIGAGLVAGLVSGLLGLAELTTVPSGTRPFRVGVVRAVLDVLVLELFATSFALRLPAGHAVPSRPAFLTAVVGLALAVISGWLGGELAERHGASLALGVGRSRAASGDPPSKRG